MIWVFLGCTGLNIYKPLIFPIVTWNDPFPFSQEHGIQWNSETGRYEKIKQNEGKETCRIGGDGFVHRVDFVRLMKWFSLVTCQIPTNEEIAPTCYDGSSMSSLDGDDWGESEWWDAALSSISSDPAWWGLEGADHDSEIPTDIDALVNICVDKRLIRTEDFWWYFISMAPTEEMIKDMIESAKKHTSLSAFYEHIIDSGLVDEWKFGEVPENHLEDVIEFVSYLTKQQLGLPPTPTSAPETPPKQRLRKMSTESALSGLSWHEGETVYSDKWGESGLIFKSSDVTGSLVEQLDMSSVNIVTYIYIYIYLFGQHPINHRGESSSSI